MARVPMVTRTIITTEVNVLCLNLTTAEPCNLTVKLSGQYGDAKKLEKAVKVLIDTDEVKAVHVVSVEEKEVLYGMPETDFIKNATVLPPREKKEQ